MRFLPALLPQRATRLRLLVLAISDRCDQRCVHCQIWMGPATGRPGLTRAERLRILEEAIALGVSEVLLTGGEPLLSPDLWPIAERLREAGVRASLATNGLLLQGFAEQVSRNFDEVYVSLDGASPTTHDGLRGVPSFERLAAGLLAIRKIPRRPLLVARSTLHARNVEEFAAIVGAARGLGFDHVSFLPLDAESGAFGGRPEARLPLRPTAAQCQAFAGEVTRLEEAGALDDGFVLEQPAKLRALAARLRPDGAAPRPECDAPWWSSVVDADGGLRPCFFHQPVADARDGLRAARGSARYTGTLAEVRAGNPTCDGCVCPKRGGVPLRERLFG